MYQVMKNDALKATTKTRTLFRDEIYYPEKTLKPKFTFEFN